MNNKILKYLQRDWNIGIKPHQSLDDAIIPNSKQEVNSLSKEDREKNFKKFVANKKSDSMTGNLFEDFPELKDL